MIVDGKGQIFEDRRKKDDRRNLKSSKAGKDKRKADRRVNKDNERKW